MTLNITEKATLMKVVSAGMASHAFIATHNQSMTVWVEARRKGKILTALAKPRFIMQSEMKPLLDGGYLRETMDGSQMKVERTDKAM